MSFLATSAAGLDNDFSLVNAEKLLVVKQLNWLGK
jgi:hypothetical protein